MNTATDVQGLAGAAKALPRGEHARMRALPGAEGEHARMRALPGAEGGAREDARAPRSYGEPTALCPGRPLHPHNVIAAVDVQGFAGDTARQSRE